MDTPRNPRAITVDMVFILHALGFVDTNDHLIPLLTTWQRRWVSRSAHYGTGPAATLPSN